MEKNSTKIQTWRAVSPACRIEEVKAVKKGTEIA